MSLRSFSSLTHMVDDAVDDHLGDPITISVRGNTYTLRATLRSEEIEQESGGMVAIVSRLYLSIQQRFLPARLAQDDAILSRVNPYIAGEPEEQFRVIAVDPEDNGRCKVVLARL